MHPMSRLHTIGTHFFNAAFVSLAINHLTDKNHICFAGWNFCERKWSIAINILHQGDSVFYWDVKFEGAIKKQFRPINN